DKLDKVNESMNRYKELLCDVNEMDIEKLCLEINESIIENKNKAKGKVKKIDGKYTFQGVNSLNILFYKYFQNFIFKILKADSGRVDEWNAVGRLGKIAINNIQDFSVIESSISGMNQKKVILMKDGKVKGEDAWVLE